MRPDDQVLVTVPADRAEAIRELMALPTPVLQWCAEVALPVLQAHAAQHPGDEPSIADLLRLLLPTVPAELRPYVKPAYRRYCEEA